MKIKSSFYWLSFAYPVCDSCKAKGEASFVGGATYLSRTGIFPRKGTGSGS